MRSAVQRSNRCISLFQFGQHCKQECLPFILRTFLIQLTINILILDNQSSSFLIIFLTAFHHLKLKMIINNSSYANASKDKGYNRDYLKKKKSHEAFYVKAKLNSQMEGQLKYLQSRKSQARVSTSLVEINQKEDPKRVSSLEMGSELCNLENIVPTKASINKQKKNIGHCWSERNMTLINDSSKMQKYRKFSSNAEMGEEQPCMESHRRKLSLVDYPNEVPKKIEKLSLTVWMILLRKLYVNQFKKRNSKTVKLEILFSYIQKLQNQGLDEFAIVVEPLEYEVDLSKSQLITILQSFFAVSKKAKTAKPSEIGRVTFCQVMGCLIQFQAKNNNIIKQSNHKSTSSQEQAVETARFQEGGGDQAKKRKLSQKKHQLNSLVPKMQTHKYIKENGKENLVASVNLGENLFKSSAACNKSKQSLNPSQSPLVGNETKSIENSRVLLQREESGPLNFKRGSFEIEGTHEESLGMLTIQGKSPRQLMVSEIYESIQREGIAHQNNVSFSLEHIEGEGHLSFQHTVHSFQEILKKIQNIQKNYKGKGDSQTIEDSKYQKSQQEVNLFLQQLLNYRIATSNEPFEQENYSYLVSFQNLTEFKDHNKGIMLALLQSTYLKEYFNALEGIKIRNSLQFLKSVSSLFHRGIRILNISHNNISNINFILDALPNQNSLEFLNINNNFFPDIAPILKKCGRLKQLHCQSNLVTQVKQGTFTRQLRIIDLSLNKIQEEDSLLGLAGIPSLIIINIFGNPITKRSWKSDWQGSINLNNIYEMQNLYVMSSYGHQKDIAFSLQKTVVKNERDRYKNTDFIHEFSISEANRFASTSDKVSKPVMNDTHLNGSKTAKQIQQPKQKISKIKAFIDGKII